MHFEQMLGFYLWAVLLLSLYSEFAKELLALTGGSHWPPIQGPVGHREKEEMED